MPGFVKIYIAAYVCFAMVALYVAAHFISKFW
jgi:hypothetical protein